MHFYTPLKNRSVLCIKGEDTFSFLQSILTNDATLLNTQPLVYSLLLNAQGKFLYDVFIITQKKEADDVVWLDILTEKKEEWRALLQRYKLRSKVQIEALDDISVYALSEKGPNIASTHTIAIHHDPRTSSMGLRAYGSDAELEPLLHTHHFDKDPDFYQRQRLSLFLPEASEDMMHAGSYPLEHGFEKFHAIDFKKGCYVGQEVTARTWYRGVIRKAMFGIVAEENTIMPLHGEITKDGKLIGKVSSMYKNHGLALCRKEEVVAGEKGEIDTVSVSFVPSFAHAL